ncbi:MAG: DUF4397 domain-containing protein [Litorilinea sp.]
MGLQSVLGIMLCALFWPVPGAHAATFTVTTTADSDVGSLRQAILDANAASGTHTILFDLGGSGVQTIQVTSPLPAITRAGVEINALGGTPCTTWPLQPKVALDGSQAGSNADGFKIQADTVRIVGLYIHSFSSDGIEIGADDALIGCNIIGLNPAGNDAGNDFYGVNIVGDDNVVGSTASILGNVISGNQMGVAIETAVDGNIIRGNYIGTNADGTQARGNDGAGVAVVEGSNTLVGGTTAADRNVISGNLDQGVWFFLAGNGNKVLGNYIGTNAAGDGPLPNGTAGVKLQESSNAQVGGPAGGEGNRIAFNTTNGVLVTPGFSGANHNRILGNDIFSNGELGIDLSSEFAGDGVTFNDNRDLDSGPNGWQNFPTITTASRIDDDTIQVVGRLNSNPNQTFRIELFSSPSCDALGFGEGASYLGSTTLQTNFAGNGEFTVDLNQSVPLGHQVTATATSNSGNAPGNTSEFSTCRTVAQAQPPSNAPQLTPDVAITPEDTPITINVLENDTAPPSTTLTLVAVTNPGSGTAEIVDNQIRYTPDQDFHGTDTFAYSAHTGNTSASRQSTVRVTVQPVNDPPSDILLTIDRIDANTGSGIIANFSVVDVDSTFHFFSLAPISSDNDNDKFFAFGRFLLLPRPLDLATRSSYTIDVRVRDNGGATLIKSIELPVDRPNLPPVSINLSNNRINENQPAGLTVGTLSSQDPDSPANHTYQLATGVGDADNDRFRIEGTTLRTDALLDFEEQAVYSIRVRSTDSGGEFRENILLVNVNNLPSPPDAPINQLSYCTGDDITLVANNSSNSFRRVAIVVQNVSISNLTATTCAVTGRLSITTNGSTVSNLPFTGNVNARNQFSSSTIPDFSINIAGIPVLARGVKIDYTAERASLHITRPAMQMPREFGGLSASITVPTLIDSNGVRFGTGTIKLPTIKTSSGFEMNLSGRLNAVSGGFQIIADGDLTIPNIGKKKSSGSGGQTCSIGAGVTIFADTEGRTVMQVAAGNELTAPASVAYLVNGEWVSLAGADASDRFRLDAIRASASCSPGLPIGQTGLFLTGLRGEITITPGEERVDVGVTIESGKSLPGIGPILALDGDMGLQPRPFELDLGVAINVLSIEVAKADASITAKSFRTSIRFQALFYSGSAEINAFSRNGRSTFTGSARISVGIKKGFIYESDCFFVLFCPPIPPFSVGPLASAGVDVGEFTNGVFGFKGFVRVLIFGTHGFFVDQFGNFSFLNVSRFRLVSAPRVAEARAAWEEANANGTPVRIAENDEFIFLASEGEDDPGGVIIRSPLEKPMADAQQVSAMGATDVITEVNLVQHGDVIFRMSATGPISFTIITPQSQEVTPENFSDSGTLGYTIGYTQVVSYESEAERVDAPEDVAFGVEGEAPPRLLFTPISSEAQFNNVDLRINGVTVYFNLNFQSSKQWLKPTSLSPGEHTIELVEHGTDNVVRSAVVNLESDTDYSVINIGGAAAGFVTIEDDNAPPTEFGQARVRFYNGASAQTNLVVNGDPLFTGINYQGLSDYAEIEAGAVTVELRDNTDNSLLAAPLMLQLGDGDVHTFFATDFSTDAHPMLLLERQDAAYAQIYQTYYSVDQAQMNEEWQLKLIGDTDNILYEIEVWGPDTPPIVAGVTVDATDLAATQVGWQVTSDHLPTTVTVFANPGEISASIPVTDLNGIVSTEEIPLFEGIQIGEFVLNDLNELGGQPVTREIDLSDLQSGTYHLWIRVDDGNNSPVSSYATSPLALAQVGIQSVYGANAVWVAKDDFDPLVFLANAEPIVVDNTNSFPLEWSATISTTFEPANNTLYVEWRNHAHPDTDTYRLLFGHTPLSPTQVITTGGAIAEFDENGEATGVEVGFTTLHNILPDLAYFISIEAIDSQTGQSVRSQEIEFMMESTPFALTSTQPVVNVDPGDTVTVPVTLDADEALFFPNVWLSTDLGGAAPGITARFVDDLEGISELNPSSRPTRQLEIFIDPTVPGGTYPIVITGYNGDDQEILSFEVIVSGSSSSTNRIFMPFATR